MREILLLGERNVMNKTTMIQWFDDDDDDNDDDNDDDIMTLKT